MPYAPGISYRGDQFLYKGLTSAVERMDRERERAKQDKKLFDSYVTQGEALGLNPDVMKVQSLGSVAGMVEGEKLKRMRDMQMAQMAHMETQDAAARQRMEWEPRMQAAQLRHYAQQDDSARNQQARAEAAARNQQAFGEAVWALASRPNTAGAEAGAEALNAVAAGMGGVPSVQGSDLVGMLPPRKAEPQEILGLMARYGQPLSAADDVGKLLGAGSANSRYGAPVWSDIQGTNYKQGYVPGSGTMMTVPKLGATVEGEPEVITVEGRKFQKVVDPRTRAESWKPLALDPAPNPEREVRGRILEGLEKEMEKNRAKAPPAGSAAKPAAAPAAPAQADAAKRTAARESNMADFLKRKQEFEANKGRLMTEAEQEALAREIVGGRRR